MIPNHDTELLALIDGLRAAPRVRAFDDNGAALILDMDAGTLRPANTHPGFQRLTNRPWVGE